MVYPGIRKSVKAQELDRGTWAQEDTIVAIFDLPYAAAQLVDVDFKTAFDGQPFFYHAVELQPGQVLVPGDFPMVNIGISQWKTYQANAALVHIGAVVSIAVTAVTQYLFTYRLAFRGIAFRNVADLRP